MILFDCDVAHICSPRRPLIRPCSPPQVGHERTLRNDEIWARWLDWAHSKNLLAAQDVILPPGWQQALQVRRPPTEKFDREGPKREAPYPSHRRNLTELRRAPLPGGRSTGRGPQ